MATNLYKNKVIYNGTTLIDLTDTTAVADDVLSGKYFYLATGQKVAGTGTGGIDGDNLAYGLSLVGSAIVGSSVIS